MVALAPSTVIVCGQAEVCAVAGANVVSRASRGERATPHARMRHAIRIACPCEIRPAAAELVRRWYPLGCSATRWRSFACGHRHSEIDVVAIHRGGARRAVLSGTCRRFRWELNRFASRREVIARVEVGPRVGRQAEPFDGRGFAIRQVLLIHSRKEGGDTLGGSAMQENRL